MGKSPGEIDPEEWALMAQGWTPVPCPQAIDDEFDRLERAMRRTQEET